MVYPFPVSSSTIPKEKSHETQFWLNDFARHDRFRSGLYSLAFLGRHARHATFQRNTFRSYCKSIIHSSICFFFSQKQKREKQENQKNQKTPPLPLPTQPTNPHPPPGHRLLRRKMRFLQRRLLHPPQHQTPPNPPRSSKSHQRPTSRSSNVGITSRANSPPRRISFISISFISIIIHPSNPSLRPHGNLPRR